MREKIEQLRRESAVLEPDAAERAILNRQVLAHTDAFLSELPNAPAFIAGDAPESLGGFPITEEAISIDTALGHIAEDVERLGISTPSSRHMGYIPGGGLYGAALGGYLADISNRYAGMEFPSPGAVRLEQQVVEWLAEIVGYPTTASGDLTSGGSVAALIALVTARDACALTLDNISRKVVYFTDQSHYSLDKALRIAGLRECIQHRVPTDKYCRMDATGLDSAIREDKAKGLSPWLIIATAGTTDVGAVDPLHDIADLAQQHEIWMHGDAAYGGFFKLCPEGEDRLSGLERCGSMVLDPHKGLFLPFGTGAVLVKDGRLQQQAHYFETPAYFQDAPVDLMRPSPCDLSPELTRPFRGLKIWLPLRLAGLAAFRAALGEKILLSRYFYERLSNIDGFELGPYPDLSIAAYRYLPRHGSANDFNLRLLEAIRQDGRLFLSSTTVAGKVMLRLCVLSFRVHLEDVEEAIEILTREARRLEREA